MVVVEEILGIERREFGFFFKTRRPMMERYKTFLAKHELDAFIENHNPDDCFVSVAYYSDSISAKGWEGADLFYDIDHESNLKLARADAETVYDTLLDDFALEMIEMNFSGAKGYHIICYDTSIHTLSAHARREILDCLKMRYHVETIDEPASSDIRRLRRLPQTKNSKTGKLCRTIKRSF